MPLNSYNVIASSTANGSSTSFSFTGIDQTYSEIIVAISMAASSGSSDYQIKFNNDATVANYQSMVGGYTNYTTTKDAISFKTVGFGYLDWNSWGSANNYNVAVIRIPQYSQTSYKKVYNFVGGSVNGTEFGHGYWASTAAINRIDIQFNNGNTIQSGSTITIFGVK